MVVTAYARLVDYHGLRPMLLDALSVVEREDLDRRIGRCVRARARARERERERERERKIQRARERERERDRDGLRTAWGCTEHCTHVVIHQPLKGWESRGVCLIREWRLETESFAGVKSNKMIETRSNMPLSLQMR